MANQYIPLVVEGDTSSDQSKLLVLADQVGPALVADRDVVARLGRVTDSIERVSREVLEAAKRAAPTKATVEIGFSLAIEQGQLLALVGKGRGEGSITVTLEWEKSPNGA